MDSSTLPDESASSDLFAPGALIAGRFRIERRIGKGGMGVVYAAIDTTLGDQRVALKTILPDLATQRVLERFKREVRYAQKITHRNVCRIFDIGHHDTPISGETTRRVHFVTMEYLAGETLERYLERVGILSPAKALPIVRELTAGLSAIHAAGVVHRDFKSANVILVREGLGTRARITDFGVACIDRSLEDDETRLTAMGGFVGSPSYIAPEQLNGSATITPAADVYALGVVLYEILTAHRPFTGSTPLQMATQRLTTPPTPPSVHLPTIDRQWEAVILRCLARIPADRYQSAAEVLAALESKPAAAEAAVAGSLETTISTAAPLKPRRHVWLLAPTAALILAGILIVWRNQQRPVSSQVATTSAAATTPVQQDPLRGLRDTIERSLWPGTFEFRTTDGRTVYTAGEHIEYRIMTDVSGHLSMFVFGSDGVGKRIFPNEIDPDGLLPVGSSALPRMGYSFPVEPPFGEDLHVAVFSEAPLPLEHKTAFTANEVAVLLAKSDVRWRAAQMRMDTRPAGNEETR